jgi:hypothetical protein
MGVYQMKNKLKNLLVDAVLITSLTACGSTAMADTGNYQLDNTPTEIAADESLLTLDGVVKGEFGNIPGVTNTSCMQGGVYVLNVEVDSQQYTLMVVDDTSQHSIYNLAAAIEVDDHIRFRNANIDPRDRIGYVYSGDIELLRE